MPLAVQYTSVQETSVKETSVQDNYSALETEGQRIKGQKDL